MSTTTRTKKRSATNPTPTIAWKNGNRIHNRPDAKVAFEELTRIKDENNGRLETETLVREAASKSNLFHNSFEWNDKAAGHQYRLLQAREIIHSIRIIEVASDEDAPPVERIAFVSVEDEDGRAYQSVETVLAIPLLRQSAIEDAIRYLEGFERRYAHLAELSPIWKVTKRVKQRVMKEAARNA